MKNNHAYSGTGGFIVVQNQRKKIYISDIPDGMGANGFVSQSAGRQRCTMDFLRKIRWTDSLVKGDPRIESAGRIVRGSMARGEDCSGSNDRGFRATWPITCRRTCFRFRSLEILFHALYC